MASPTPFGAPMRKHFLIDPNYRNLNHGSFGTYPKPVLQAQQSYQAALESRPDVYIRYTQPTLIDTSRERLASLVKVPSSSIVLVKNATTAVNTILHNLTLAETLKAKDVVIYFETVYGAVERALFALRDANPGIRVRKVKVTFPMSDEEVVARFRRVVEDVRREGLVPKLAVFETIVSLPGVRFPFETMVDVCKEEGILSLLDAAHGVGIIEVDLGRLGVDFWTSNCHKWLFTPRSCAILYVAPQHQHLIRTSLPTSWGYIPAPRVGSQNADEEGEEELTSVLPDTGKSAFITLFEFIGTTDDSAYACVPDALKFREQVCGGEEKIRSYLEHLAGEAGGILAEALGTEVMLPDGGRKTAGGGLGCGMVTVRLPVRVVANGEESGGGGSGGCVQKKHVVPLARWIETQLVEKGTFVPVFQHGEWLWTRLSAQVYLERRDFEWLADALKGVLGKVQGYLDTLKVPVDSSSS
ncbi:pyridoxal phosphate-dependent transferase [Aspergillus egyptiacus]|nr:pyridoxal phosphate-dependent transferase [Aspergillus egyptiacus]